MRRPKRKTWRDLSTTAKGYGREHKALRLAYIRAYIPGVTLCVLGGEVLNDPPEKLDLAHSEDRRITLGLACWKHNRGDAARKGNAKKKTRPWRQPSPGRRW